MKTYNNNHFPVDFAKLFLVSDDNLGTSENHGKLEVGTAIGRKVLEDLSRSQGLSLAGVAVIKNDGNTWSPLLKFRLPI